MRARLAKTRAERAPSPVDHARAPASAEGTPNPAALDPFSDFVARLVSAAEPMGVEAASQLKGLLIAPEDLRDKGLLLRLGGEEVLRTTRAWREVLRGRSFDLSECGGLSLDEWGADLLTRFTGQAGSKERFRRALRDRGVVAFGLLDAA